VDPHLLRTFVAVGRRGSFSAAAGELGYTQSAVSQHIAALEADLRAPLLRRRPVALTDAGVRLLEHAEPLLLRLAAARADVTRIAAVPAARLVVGVSALAATARFAAKLADLRLARPLASVTVRVLERAAVAAGVADGTLDLGLIDGVAAPSDPLHLPDVGPLTSLAVSQERLVLPLPAGHPLSGRPGIRLADLADARWIDAPEVAMPLDRLRAASGSDGFRPSLRYEGTDVRGLIALAVTGHGLALLPEPALEGGAAGVPVTEPRLTHRVELLHGGPHGGLPDGPAALLAAALTA
jgi:DNA-binding transcriptional LysR family regulator